MIFSFSTNAFDVDKAREAAKLFVGYHDFRTFMHKGTKLPDKITRRTIEMLNIEEQPLNYYTKYSWPFCINNKLTEYKFFHIYVKSNGFLYKQVSFVSFLFSLQNFPTMPSFSKF